MNENSVEEKSIQRRTSALPITIAILLLISSVIYIVARSMSNKAYYEKWKDYDECGLG